MARATWARRAHSTTPARCAASAATAVPHDPDPTTATLVGMPPSYRPACGGPELPGRRPRGLPYTRSGATNGAPRRQASRVVGAGRGAGAGEVLPPGPAAPRPPAPRAR